MYLGSVLGHSSTQLILTHLNRLLPFFLTKKTEITIVIFEELL